jgi:hypothetical protein
MVLWELGEDDIWTSNNRKTGRRRAPRSQGRETQQHSISQVIFRTLTRIDHLRTSPWEAMGFGRGRTGEREREKERQLDGRKQGRCRLFDLEKKKSGPVISCFLACKDQ